MQIKINDEPEEIAEERLTVSRLLELKQVESPEMVAVQVNGVIVERDAYGTTVLADNDVLDFFTSWGEAAGGERLYNQGHPWHEDRQRPPWLFADSGL